MEKRIYLIEQVLGCDHGKCLTMSPTVSTVQNHLVNIMANISIQFLLYEKYHTKTDSLTFNQWRKRSTGVTLQRRNNIEGRYRKTIIWRQIHHIFFFYNGLYVHIPKKFKQNKCLFFFF